jgi:3-oxoadipate enol-lactonase
MELMVPVPGGEISAEDTGGDGTAGVFVNADWSTAGIWSPVMDLLADRFRLIRYDDRGFGHSLVPAGPFTRLGDLRALVEHAGVATAVVVGHSGGGGTALGLALAEPERVASLILVAPGVRGDREYPMVANCADAIASRIPGCDHVIITGADHMLPLRAPARLAEIIIERAGG